ncbi:MAG: glutamyl-tRNA reductase [Vicinamibacterales bacterium]
MRLLVVGLSHRTAPIELRETVDFARGGLDAALTSLADRGICQEAVVLSTCNRAEVYAVTDTAADADRLAHFFSEYHQLDHRETAAHLYSRSGGDAALHLFRVAAGLDSLVVGEPQILGQVKAAYQTAADRQFTGPLLNRLFHSSFATGKRVRTETGLGEGAVSISYAAIALAKKIFGKLSGLGVLIIGAGEMAALTATHLRSQQVRQLTIASRTLASAERLAKELDATAAPWTAIDDVLGTADIVVTATGATDAVLTRARVENVMRTRPHRPLFIIDIAVPRDVEPSVGDLEQVFLYNIDDLQTIVRENLARRSGELTRAEAIVTDEVTRFVSWMQSREVIPTVVALRQRFESIHQSELRRLEPKLAALPPEARARVDEVTRLIVEKLLLTPTEQLKAVSDESTIVAYAEALNRLFRLAAQEQQRDPPAAAPADKANRS